jgi:hypothetical protein
LLLPEASPPSFADNRPVKSAILGSRCRMMRKLNRKVQRLQSLTKVVDYCACKIHPTPRRKEQEHNVCAVVVAPNPGMARIATSKAMEIPACKNKLNGKVSSFTALMQSLPR